jgi:hypothetical protein
MLPRLAALAVVAATFAAPAASAAPTLSTDRECYGADRDTVALSGSGYTPGGAITLLFGGRGQFLIREATADASGAFAFKLPAPTLETLGYTDMFRAPMTVTATDETQDQFAAAEVTLTGYDVYVKPWATMGPAAGRPRHMTVFDALGWTTLGDRLYAHYLRGGKLVRTVRLGSLTGPCGDLRVRMREFPFRPVPAGRYRVQFDTTRAYHKLGIEYSYYYKAVVVSAKRAVR